MSLPLFAVKLIYELNLTNISKYERIYLVVVVDLDLCMQKVQTGKNEQNEANKRALNKSSNTKNPTMLFSLRDKRTAVNL